MNLLQIIVLAVVQGITEFLPISSSGHLLLIPLVTGWTDQGLATDVMVHVGSLIAILVYFRKDVSQLIIGGLDLFRGRMTKWGKLALMLLAATIPAVAVGFLLKETGTEDAIRANPSLIMKVVGWNAIIFGILLYFADRIGPRLKVMEDLRFSSAILIGLAQALSLIPGTSRSGITITAARFMGFERPEAARFSFLLGMPAIAGAGLLTALEAAESGIAIAPSTWAAAGLSFVASIAAIVFLMALIRRMSFLPFVIYRLILGVILLWIAYT